MSELVRITNFNPEKVAPNFISYLKAAGDVTFGEEIEFERRRGARMDGQSYDLAVRKVLLNGETIGQLSVGLEPPMVLYNGKLPTSLIPATRLDRIRFPNGRDSQGFIRVSLNFHAPSVLVKETGRNDGWKEIPLP